jgi:type II secretory pathway component PulM
MVVEELRPQAATCGLSQAPLEALVTKAFTDAGLKVLRDSDEDTYVYVDINTSSLSTGLCVSRYDVYLFTHTMARLSHQSSPVLVQVQLRHQGGMAGGAAATHGDAVRRNVTQAVESFASRIRAASAR